MDLDIDSDTVGHRGGGAPAGEEANWSSASSPVPSDALEHAFSVGPKPPELPPVPTKFAGDDFEEIAPDIFIQRREVLPDDRERWSCHSRAGVSIHIGRDMARAQAATVRDRIASGDLKLA